MGIIDRCRHNIHVCTSNAVSIMEKQKDKYVQKSVNIRNNQQEYLDRNDVHLNFSSFVREKLDEWIKKQKGGMNG